MENRKCIKCGQEKLLTKDNFYFYKRNQFRRICIECCSKKNKEYRQQNAEKLKVYNYNRKENRKKYAAEYRKNNKQKEKRYYLSNQEKLKNQAKEYRRKVGLVTGIGQSLQEKQITDYLIKNQINFESEKTFEDCRNKENNLLHFDFYLSELNILIEYDGIFHYEPIFKEAFDKIKEHDQIKTNYCLQKGIKLIRISYKEDLEQVLNKIFKLEYAY